MFLPRRTIAIHASRYLLGLVCILWAITFGIGLLLLPNVLGFLLMAISLIGFLLLTYLFSQKKGLFIEGWLHLDEHQLYWQHKDQHNALLYTWHKSSRYIDGLMVIHLRHPSRPALRLIFLKDTCSSDDLRHLRVWWRWS